MEEEVLGILKTSGVDDSSIKKYEELQMNKLTPDQVWLSSRNCFLRVFFLWWRLYLLQWSGVRSRPVCASFEVAVWHECSVVKQVVQWTVWKVERLRLIITRIVFAFR